MLTLQGIDNEELLEKEKSNLDLLKSRINRNNQLVNDMTTLLSTFEGCLSKLEETILPVYNETEMLQQRQQNMEKTLQVLDNIINLYSVSKDVEYAIKLGPGTKGVDLEEYLQAMNKLQQAKIYFEKHNSQSVELENIITLFNTGYSTLLTEFQEQLSKHSKPVLPIILLDLLSIDDDSNLSENSAPLSLPSIPEDVHSELTTITNWLFNSNKLEFLDVWATVRGANMLKSLKMLRDHQKSASGGSITGVAFTSSPMMKMKFPNRHEVSRKSSTRRFHHVFEKKANKMFLKASQTLENSTGLSLGGRRASSNFENQSMNEEFESSAEMEHYLICVSALHKLMQSEQSLIQTVIPVQYQNHVFERTVRESMDLIVQDGENIAARAKRCIMRHDFGAVLVLFPILKQLRGLRPDFERTVEHCDFTLRNKFASIISILEETSLKALDDFLESIRTECGALPPDGTVHELTSNVLVFLEQLKECALEAGSVLAYHGTQQPKTSLNLISNNPSKTNDLNETYIALLANYIKKLLNQLNLTLLTKSDSYNDPALKAIFRLNNTHHTLVTMQRSGLLAMTGDTNLEKAYHDMIQEHKYAYQQSWNKLLSYIWGVDNLPINILQDGKLRDKDRIAIKDRFSGFNKEMDEIAKIQRGYSIPDVELRESLKRDNKEYILPKYNTFYEQYSNIQFTKNPEKYLKYSPSQVSSIIDRFFDVAA